jgi:hypothetical protein
MLQRGLPGRHAAPQPGTAEALVLTGLRLCHIGLYLTLSDDIAPSETILQLPERHGLVECSVMDHDASKRALLKMVYAALSVAHHRHNSHVESSRSPSVDVI